MSRQTEEEKIALAAGEVNIAEIMVDKSRLDLEKWINLLNLRRETLKRLKDGDAKA